MLTRKWTVVKKGNGKFSPRLKVGNAGAYWPYSPSEFDTFEEAKLALINKKEDLEKVDKENTETTVFELS